MTMKRYLPAIVLFVAVFAATATGAARAQEAPVIGNLLRYTTALRSADPGSGAYAATSTDSDVVLRGGSVSKVVGYRICIFADNDQDARTKAMAAAETFDKQYRGNSAEVVYENPYFRVFVGPFLTYTEASAALGRLRANFPSAFIRKPEEFPIGVFSSRAGNVEVQETPEIPAP